MLIAQDVEVIILRVKTKALGLSLGDRLCVALGRHLGKPVVTTDRQWEKLSIDGIEVQLAR